VALVALVYPLMMVWDLIIEGAFTNLGFYTMAGGRLSFFPDSYSKFPLLEPVFIATLLTPVVALRFFRNDRGETVIERGVDGLRVSERRKVLLRALAVIGFIQLNYLLMYNIPVAAYMGVKPGVWPAQVQAYPYLTDHLCGATTGRLCPGPGIPLTQQAWVSARTGQPRGRLRGPGSQLGSRGAERSARNLQQVPLASSPLKAFSGRVLGDRSR
jgi:Spirocyclase AveC-like